MQDRILVGDIGSTKSTWWFHTDKSEMIQLEGYNPVSHTEDAGTALLNTLYARTRPYAFSRIWYYGTGVMDRAIAESIRIRLSGFFPESEIHVASDLMGAAIASCGNLPGCVAILGTGSHAAVFDGHRIIRQAISLGYMLGDEGGGCDIGKLLLQAYFYHEMPEPIRLEMAPFLPEGREGFLTALKMSAVPNQYLAEFARVAVVFQDHPWIREQVRSRFKLFVKRHVAPLEPDKPVHIVGSIGCIFAGLIREELKNAGFQPGRLIQDPAHRLFEIHMEHGKEKS